ncbi:hypothetical protein AAC387_Pa11g1889 [Persea americana]
MALIKNPRVDSRFMSSYRSTITIIVFIVLCLIGVWMMTSSTVMPVQNIEMSREETNSEAKGQVAIQNESQQFQAGSGGVRKDDNTDTLPDDANSEVNQNQNLSEKTNENQVEESKEENSMKEGEDKENKPDNQREKETATVSEETSRTKTSNEEDSAKETEDTKDVKESNDESKTESEDENESDERSGNETTNESDDASKNEKNETGSKSDDTNKTEGDNESDDASLTKIANESNDDTSKTEDGNDGNEKMKSKESLTTGGEVSLEHKESNTEGGETNKNGQSDAQGKEPEVEKNSKPEETAGETALGEEVQSQIEEKVEQNQRNETEQNSIGNKTDGQGSNEFFPDPAQSELLNETNTNNGTFSTQAVESKNEKESQQSSSSEDETVNKTPADTKQDAKEGDAYSYNWKLCNVTVGADYIPCLDNEEAIKKLQSTKHYEHRERHCPEEGPTCLVPLPEGYRQQILWPDSRDKIWYYNVPHTQLALFKGHQNWVKVTGEFLTFPGGGTQFVHGALHYIDFIEESVPKIAWARRSRVVLDVGCGVASFGGYLFEKDVLTMSFAPKDEHEAQVQFALERGIPAVSAVMGTKRLPFPSKVFDIVHCARCRVPWHIEGGTLLLELNRVLRPGGYFVWSATPVYRKREEDVGIWEAMSSLTKSMCWDLVSKKYDKVNKVGVAIYRKPSSNDCYQERMEAVPPLCEENDDPDAAWNVPLKACMHRVPVGVGERGSQWPEKWPQRLEKTPLWLNDSQIGVYGKAAPKDFETDYEHWKHVVSNSYLRGMGIDWSTVRNVLDMRSSYGGFAAALRDIKVWVMNVVTVDSQDTLPIIYERGLFGIYHDWCESFSTYPRTYDLLHADHLFSKLKTRCKLLPVIAEVDRILRPKGKLIVRDTVDTIGEIENFARSLHWEIRLTYSKDKEGLLCTQKTTWRPQEVETNTSSMA